MVLMGMDGCEDAEFCCFDVRLGQRVSEPCLVGVEGYGAHGIGWL